MPNNEGRMYKVIFGVIVFILTVFGSAMGVYNNFHVPLVQAIQTEKEKRADEDTQIRKEQTVVNQQILLVLGELKNDIKWIKEKTR